MPFGLICRIGCKEVSDKKMESCCWNVGLMSLVGVGCKVGSIEGVGGGGCEMENFDGVGGGSSHVGTSEVVGGGGIEVVGECRDERINFKRERSKL